MKKIYLTLLFFLVGTTLAIAARYGTVEVIGRLNIPNSATLPSTCTTGDQYMDSDATSGQRLYLCESTDTWALQGDGGGGASLETTDIDTFSELDTIVADVSLTHNGLIDTYSEINTIVADVTLTHNGLIDTFSELDAVVADQTLVHSGSNIATATALAANGSNCSAGEAPLGVDASGAVESCTDYEEDLANEAGLETAVGGANVIVSTEIDTYSELNTIVADQTLTHNGLIDTFSELDTIVADKNLVNKADGAVWLGAHDFGGATVEVPNSTSLPGTCTVGEVYIDSDATTSRVLYACESTDTWAIVGATDLTSSVTHTIGDGSSGDVVLTFNGDAGTDGTFTWDVSEDAFNFSNVVKFLADSAPTVDTAADVAFDTDIWGASRGTLLLYDGTAGVGLVGILTSDTCSNGEVPKFNTGGTWTCESDDNTSGFTVGDTQVVYALSADTPGGEAAFSYNDTTNTLFVDNITLAPSATPTSAQYDSDTTDGDANTQQVTNCTGTGSNVEYCDWTASQQINGAMTAFLTADADGEIKFSRTTSINNTTASGGGSGGLVLLTQDDGTVMQVNERLGSFGFNGAEDGVGNIGDGAGIAAFATGTWSGSSHPTKMVFYTTVAGSTTPVGNLTIDPDGSLFFENGTVYMEEIADANGDLASWGQLWINTATPNEFWFTDDAGTDFPLGGADIITHAQIADADQQFSFGIVIETPVDADDLLFYRANEAFTVTGVDCIVESATSAVVVIVECDSAGDNCGTSRFTESVTCDVDGQADDGLAETGVVAGAWIRAQVGTVTGTPGHVAITVSGTWDD
jgi:hypothetical protein